MLTAYCRHGNPFVTIDSNRKDVLKTRKHPATPSGLAAPGPFAALASLRGTLPAGTAEAPAEPQDAPPLGGRVIITRERKGRGGRTVTVIRGITPAGPRMEALAREMRQALGTGGSIEGDSIVLGGNQTERAAAWLRTRGITQITIGN